MKIEQNRLIISIAGLLLFLFLVNRVACRKEEFAGPPAEKEVKEKISVSVTPRWKRHRQPEFNPWRKRSGTRTSSLSDGVYSKSIRMIEEAYELEQFSQGEVAAQRGEWEKALTKYERALRRQPSNNFIKQKISYAQLALQSEKADNSRLISRASELIQYGNYREAEQVLTDAIANNSENPFIQSAANKMLYVCYRETDKNRAKEYLQKAYEADRFIKAERAKNYLFLQTD